MSDDLKKLVKRWHGRMERLRRKSAGIGKIKTEANQYHSNIFFDQFLEIQKCRSELMRLINKLEKANGKEKKKTI